MLVGSNDPQNMLLYFTLLRVVALQVGLCVTTSAHHGKLNAMDTLIVVAAKYLYLVILLIALIYWWRRTTKDKIYLAVLSAIAGVIGILLIKLTGKFYFDPRPFVSQHVQPLIAHVADNGFPSDHATLSAIIAFIVMVRSRMLGAILLVLAVTVGVARVAARVHSPIDILGGILIALVATGIAYLVAPVIITKLTRKRLNHDKI